MKPQKLAAFQFSVRAEGNAAKDPSLVLDGYLPKEFRLDADLEVLGNPGAGQFQIGVTTDFNDALLGQVRINHEKHSVELPFIPNRNWVQVAHFQRRFWLYNGYNRVYSLMALGVNQIPCIIFEAATPFEAVGNDLDLQSFQTLCAMPRPPLMKDYFTKAAITIPRRKHRYMLVASVQIGREQVPV